jgi:hypothetical protein
MVHDRRPCVVGVEPSRRLRFLAGAAAMLFMFVRAGNPAYCDTIVSGSLDVARVEAHGSSIAEILNELSKALPVRYRTSVELNQTVTGSFEGPALKILSRLLQEYDYIVKRNGAGELEVVVLKPRGRDSSKVISTIPGAAPQGYPSTEVNTGDPAVKGGPYPHPQWRARSYVRTIQPKTTSGR